MKTVDACSSTRLSSPRSHLLQTWHTNGRKIELFYSEKGGLKAKITKDGTVIKVPKIWIRGIPTEIQMRPDVVKACVENTWVALTQSRIGEYAITIHGRLSGGMFEPPPQRPISVEEIITKVEQANQYAQDNASGKDIILVVGNTGAGKSAFVNYLAGCRMREECVPGSIEKGVIADNPIMEIGHGFNSLTAFPQLHTDPKSYITYCDCPGFLDNRGPECDVSNAFAIKAIVEKAKSIKGIVVIVNYSSLRADKGRSLFETVALLIQLLGVREQDIADHRHSIQILISKGHSLAHVNRDVLRSYMQEANNPIINALMANVGFYDPLDRKEAIERGAIPRTELVKMLQASPSIEGAKHLFGTALGQDSRLALREFAALVNNEVRTKFQENHFKEVDRIFKTLQRLQMLELNLIREAFEPTASTIRTMIRGLEGNDASLSLLEKIRAEMGDFITEANASILIIQNRIRDQEAQAAAIRAAEEARRAAEQARREQEQREAAARAQLLSEQAAASIHYPQLNAHLTIGPWQMHLTATPERSTKLCVACICTDCLGKIQIPVGFIEKEAFHVSGRGHCRPLSLTVLTNPRVFTLNVQSQQGSPFSLQFQDSKNAFANRWLLSYQPISLDIQGGKMIICLRSVISEQGRLHDPKKWRGSLSIVQMKPHTKVVVVDLNNGGKIIQTRDYGVQSNPPCGVKIFEEGIYVKLTNNTHEIWPLSFIN